MVKMRLRSWCRQRLLGGDGDDGGAYEKVTVLEGSRALGKPPRGQLVVYVGSNEMERERVFLPVEYVNHPLFAGLLPEVEEEEYRFGKEGGGIIVPCDVSVFNDVRSQIAASLEVWRHWGWKRCMQRIVTSFNSLDRSGIWNIDVI